MLVGWATVVIAAKQRVKATWLTVGLILVALMNTSAQIHASRTLVHRGPGHVSMDLPLGSSLHAIYQKPIACLGTFLALSSAIRPLDAQK
jgi:hypothetical protein